jgi:Domain of unknown function (DUF4389)
MEASQPVQPPPPPTEPPVAVTGATDYPVDLDCPRQDEYNRFLPLVKWLLAIPHYFVLAILFIGVFFAKIIAFFAVLFTRRYPAGLFDYVRGVLRWSWRVNSYTMLLTDRYPPFTLAADADHPAQLRIDYPEAGIDRWRPLVHWLLIIPYAIVASVLHTVAVIVAFIGIFVILFTEQLPEGMYKLILIPNRWTARGATYAMFMVNRYPPFEWE